MPEDKKQPGLSPNDTLDGEGNVVAQEPEIIGKRIAEMMKQVDGQPQKITGYRVWTGWTAPGVPPVVVDKQGAEIKPSDIKTPAGVKPEAFLAELVANGNIIADYEKDAEAPAPAIAPPTPTNSPAPPTAPAPPPTPSAPPTSTPHS